MQLKSVLGSSKFQRFKQTLRNNLSPEEKLLSLIHPSASVEHLEFSGDLLNEDTLYQLSVRHRLIPDIFHLTTIHPDWFSTEFIKKISSINQRKIKQGFQQTREMVLLLDRFRKNNLLAVPLKGAILGQMLYQDLGKRFSSDIDIFLHANDIEKAEREIVRAGYRRVQPPGHFSGANELYARYKKDFMYVHPGKKVNLEIHWQLSSNNLLIENAHTFLENLNEINFAGHAVKVMKDEYQFFYLTIHGAMHQFFRLFWLRDIAACTQKLSDKSHKEVIKITAANKLELPFISAVVAAHIFYGTPVPNPVMEMHWPNSLYTTLRIIFSRIHGNEEMLVSERVQKLYYLTLFKSSLRYKIRCLSGIYFRHKLRKNHHLGK